MNWSICACAAAIFTAVALGQDNASLTVTVVDPSAATIPGAAVTVTDLSRGIVAAQKTDRKSVV